MVGMFKAWGQVLSFVLVVKFHGLKLPQYLIRFNSHHFNRLKLVQFLSIFKHKEFLPFFESKAFYQK